MFVFCLSCGQFELKFLYEVPSLCCDIFKFNPFFTFLYKVKFNSISYSIFFSFNSRKSVKYIGFICRKLSLNCSLTLIKKNTYFPRRLCDTPKVSELSLRSWRQSVRCVFPLERSIASQEILSKNDFVLSYPIPSSSSGSCSPTPVSLPESSFFSVSPFAYQNSNQIDYFRIFNSGIYFKVDSFLKKF